ncbi:MAG: hypothetical protein JSU61_05195 [Fidelibacterota bacterium]|nr:MAG: hypothetical protein JSU61_05195 [Candidatus Neomarinimicrobiota bacterium]
MLKRTFILIFLLGSLGWLGCERDPVAPPEGEPTLLYLGDDWRLRTAPGPSDGWLYITNYLYPTGTTSSSWQIFLTRDISGTTYGYDLIFWSGASTTARIEFVLIHEGEETILASQELDIPYIDEQTAIHHNNTIEGDNPLGGNEEILLFRIGHAGGSAPIEILFDGAPQTIGCSSITVPLL